MGKKGLPATGGRKNSVKTSYGSKPKIGPPTPMSKGDRVARRGGKSRRGK